MKLRPIPFLVALAAATAAAQTGGSPAGCEYTQPYMYLWDTPAGTIDRSIASQMVRDFVDPYDDDPIPAGQHFAALALYQINTSNTTDANHVCLVRQALGFQGFSRLIGTPGGRTLEARVC